MKKATLFILLILLLIENRATFGQNNEQKSNTSFGQKGLYVAGQLSTNGWGGDMRYVFNKAITLKLGLERLNLSKNMDYSEGGMEYDAKLNYSTGGVFLIADFNYTKNLYITAGASLNSLNPEIKGVAVSELQYGDIVIPASMVGDFTFSLTPSQRVSPYVGAGFRSFLGAKERVSFYFETGFYYIGAPNVEVEATGLLSPTADPVHGQKELLESQLSQYKFYPVIKINLAIKLF